MLSAMIMAWVLLGLPAGDSGGEKEPADATVQSIKGQVELLRSGAEEWQSLKEGDELWAGDAVRTGKRSQAVIKMGANIEIRVSSNGQLLVRPQEPDDDAPGVALVVGRLLARVTSAGGPQPFEVETTNAVAGVRGTVFSVAVGEDGAFFSEVEEGKVEVQGEDSLLLEPGQAAEVGDEQKTSRLSPGMKAGAWLKARRIRLLANAEQMAERWREGVEERLARLREGAKKLAELRQRLLEVEGKLASARRAGREKMIQAASERLRMLRREMRRERRRLWRLGVWAQSRLEPLQRLASAE